MFEAKRVKGSTFCFNDHNVERALARADRLREELPMAMEQDQLELYFQPRLDVLTDRVRCIEALVRWNHPNDGQLLPNEFLPLTEASDILIAVDQWVLARALEHMKEWSVDNPDLSVSVNISTCELTDLALADGMIVLVHQCSQEEPLVTAAPA